MWDQPACIIGGNCNNYGRVNSEDKADLFYSFRFPFPCLCVKDLRPCNDSRASVMEGKIDAFFTPAESEPFSMLSEMKMYSSQLVFCISRSDPSACLKEITIEETLERPMATLNSSMPFDGYKNLILRTSQQDLVRKIVAAGTACSVLPQDMVEDWEGIVFIPFTPPRPFTVKLVWNKSVPHNSAFDDLMTFVENYDIRQI